MGRTLDESTMHNLDAGVRIRGLYISMWGEKKNSEGLQWIRSHASKRKKKNLPSMYRYITTFSGKYLLSKS